MGIETSNLRSLMLLCWEVGIMRCVTANAWVSCAIDGVKHTRSPAYKQ